MAAPTNPFAAAIEAHKDEPEQIAAAPYKAHNPFAPAPAAAPETASTFPSSASNPFAQTTGFDNTTSAPYSIPEPQHQQQSQQQPSDQFGSHQYESANEISQQLSGLDFLDQSADSSTSREPSPYPQLNQPEVQETAPAMTAVYAPPPGPPPGHIDNFSSYTQQPPQQPLQQQQRQDSYPTQAQPAPTNGANATQTDADEAYARQLLAEDEARVMQRRGGRQQSSNNGRSNKQAQPPISSSRSVPLATTQLLDPNEEKQWNTKEIYWQHRLQRIIIQNENGPCSLIALCNVLLLRGTLQITPEDRPAVSYSYLSSLLGEHLIDVISTSGSSSGMELEAALSILPQTQYGLDVNVCFNSIFGFSVDEGETAPSSLIDLTGEASGSSTPAPAALPNAEKQKQKGELALFKLCNVPLVHGWLADEDDKDTWGAVVERSGDYDKALDRVVAGDEIAKGSIVEGQQGNSSRFATDSLPSQQALLVKDAILIRNFLEATATQLTYPGLYALSTKLERGTPYALFRNSHISVLYRPTEEELHRAAESLDSASSAAQPQLYQLVTDSTLENEDGIVWESVEDVDGSASRFYDGKFIQSTPSQDFIGNQENGNQGLTGEDADFAYAQQLQDQESQRARRSQRPPQQGSRRRQVYDPPPNQGASQTGGSGGGMSLISRMLAGRKSSNKQKQLSSDARTNVFPHTPDLTGITMPPSDSSERLTNPAIDRYMAEQRRSEREGQLQEADRSNFYPLTNDIRGLTMPPQSTQANNTANQGTEAGQEYPAKKEKWYKKLL